MTDNPLGPVTFTAEEKAMLAGTAEVKLEETTDAAEPDQRPAAEDSKPVPETDAKAEGEGTGEAEEEEGEEEVIEVADGTNPDGTPRRKVISYSAFRKADARAKKLADELRSTKEQVAYLTGLSQNAQNTQKPAQQPQQTEELSLTPPDKTKEPEKYLAWLETGMARLLKHQQQTTEQSQQSTQFQQINQTVFEHEQAFINGDPAAEIEPHPDFHDAVKFLQDRHKAELKEAGYEPHEIQQIMAARAQSVALKALQAGKSPAERVYSLAKLNGYKRAQPKPVETEAEKIARQAESQKKAGKTISALPGGESKGGLTAETLANMEPSEFLKMWNKGEAKALMGWKD
jgi:hypothetical protein